MEIEVVGERMESGSQTGLLPPPISPPPVSPTAPRPDSGNRPHELERDMAPMTENPSPYHPSYRLPWTYGKSLA